MPISAAQLELRKNHLGSSDIAAILGLDHRNNAYDIYAEKTGKVDPRPDRTWLSAGQLFEYGVLDWAEGELGKMTRNQYRSAKSRGLPIGANIDAILNADGVPVEAKTAGLFGPLQETWGEADTDQVPDRVIVQAHAHMITTQKDTCHVVAFIAGRGFVKFLVTLDEFVSDEICKRAVDFWENNVLADVPPDAKPNLPLMKRIRREPEKVTTIDGSLITEWQSLKLLAKKAEAQADEKEAEILALLGDAEAAECELGMFTYLQQSRSSVDGKLLKSELPEIHARFLKTSVFRVARFKANKEKK